MATKISTVLRLGLALSLWGLLAGTLAAQQKPEDIPDAPSATRPIPPPAPPSPRQEAEEESKPEAPPANAPGSGESSSSRDMPRSVPDSADQKPVSPPMPPVITVPAGSVPKDAETGQDVGYIIRVTKNVVLVPVTVKERDGRLVAGLQPKDFSVLENGQRQKLEFFTSDPFALSAAVIFDTGMPDVGV